MVAVMQNVSSAQLRVNNNLVSAINNGAIVFVGVFNYDEDETAEKLANKIVKTRIFEDDNGKINLNAINGDKELLIVSNFTLVADLTSGNRPNFGNSASKDEANRLFDVLVEKVKELGVKVVKTGVFGENMKIITELNGPINLVLDTNSF